MDDDQNHSTRDLMGVGDANGVSDAEYDAYTTALQAAQRSGDVTNSCYWSFCGQSCAVGYMPQAQAKGQVGGIQYQTTCTGDVFQTLCCAPGTTMGQCQWEGWRGVGMPCSPSACSGEGEVVAWNSESNAMTKKCITDPWPANNFAMSDFSTTNETCNGNKTPKRSELCADSPRWLPKILLHGIHPISVPKY